MPSRVRAKNGKQYRTVIPCQHVGKPTKRTGAMKLWAFGIKDLAMAAEKTNSAVRQDIARGLVDPADMKSVMLYIGRCWQKKWKLIPYLNPEGKPNPLKAP